jgi:hypothetical protein
MLVCGSGKYFAHTHKMKQCTPELKICDKPFLHNHPYLCRGMDELQCQIKIMDCY